MRSLLTTVSRWLSHRQSRYRVSLLIAAADELARRTAREANNGDTHKAFVEVRQCLADANQSGAFITPADLRSWCDTFLLEPPNATPERAAVRAAMAIVIEHAHDTLLQGVPHG
jgi:hypothetical protein